MVNVNNKHEFGKPITDGGTPTMVVVGDSVAWGQGLVHDKKFATRFFDRLTGGAALPRAAIKAHSGAVIRSRNGTGNRDVALKLANANELQSTTRQGHHEFPYGPLTVHEQVERLPNDYTDQERPERLDVSKAYGPDETVDIVLITAGINDIGGGNISNPFGDPESIEKAVRDSCYSRMKRLLRRTQQRFPDATIIVTGYHLFLSTGPDGSDIVSNDDLAVGLQVLFGLLSRPAGAVLGALYGAVELSEELAAAHVEYFYQQSAHNLRKAVTEQDKANTGASVLFASPNYNRRNAAAADDPWVWPPLSRGDPAVASERSAVCQAMSEPPIEEDSVKCPIAPSLHPNEAGADAIARAVHARYEEATGRRSVRNVIGNLSENGGISGPTSVREELERFAGVDGLIDPAEGLRTCFNQLVVDSIRVVIKTSDDRGAGNQSTTVSLDLGALTRNLDDTFGQQGFNHANFSQGAKDDFTIDPLLDTGWTERDPLHLWEISKVELEQDQSEYTEFIDSQWWKVESFALYLNGIRVVQAGPFDLDGDDSQSFNYPKS
ncbi:hypothetical protein C439_02092 [Haloferax mediterranei ATCC 33500]|nr:hypothetical protein BM92_00725 [Haloferax mediterranei ATCC 33500]EMA04427.1 hypothetical protein C439_02092 [Haloferax mediterranei ATCC 33500]